MKVNQFSVPHANCEPYRSPSSTILENLQLGGNSLKALAKPAAPNVALELAYATVASPGQKSLRYASLMDYEKSRTYSHTNVKIEPWCELTYA